MPSQSYSFSASSSSYSSTTTGQGTHSYSEQTFTDPSGTQRRTVTQEPGRAPVEERTHYPGGRRVQDSGPQSGQGRIEDVTETEESEADKKYKEKMEEEYAKREGGA